MAEALRWLWLDLPEEPAGPCGAVSCTSDGTLDSAFHSARRPTARSVRMTAFNRLPRRRLAKMGAPPTTVAEPRRQPKVKKGAPLPWKEEALPDTSKPVIPVDPDEAATGFRRDAKRKNPRLLDAVPE